jgi:hypothetical protein
MSTPMIGKIIRMIGCIDRPAWNQHVFYEVGRSHLS